MTGVRQNRSRLLVGGVLTAMAALSGLRLRGYDPVPWGWIAAFLVGTAVLAGPTAWITRERLPKQRRERLGYVLVVAALLALPVLLGVGLLAGNLLVVLDAAVFGSVLGLAVAQALERAVVPERLRGDAAR